MPGQHACTLDRRRRSADPADITAPALSLGAHPFSISSSAHALDDPREAYPAEADQSFIIRVRNGFTKRLAEYARGERDAVGPQRVNGPTLPPSKSELSDKDVEPAFPSRRLRCVATATTSSIAWTDLGSVTLGEA